MEPTCTSHQDTSHKDGDGLSSLDTSCREHPKNMDSCLCSGSKEDQGSKEVAEERSRVQVLEDRGRVMEEKKVVVWREFGQEG